MRAWIYLVVAGALEVVFAFGLKATSGPHRALAWPITLLTMAASLWLLSVAMRELPAGTSYAVWTGIGAVGTASVGMLFFGEPRSWLRVACIALVIVGIAGLQLTSATETASSRKKTEAPS
jgi:quaternary ammonium compound-resistance protein SugE